METFLGREIGVAVPDSDAAAVLRAIFLGEAMPTLLAGTVSSQGTAPPQSVTDLLCEFVRRLLAVVSQPLSAGDQRQSRLRLCRKAVGGLPPPAAALLDAVQQLDSVLDAALADPAVLPVSQPHRHSRLACQQLLHTTTTKMRAAKEHVEDALNDLNSIDDVAADEDQRNELYATCDDIYSGVLVERIAVAEALLSVRVALTVRTDEVVSFAAGQLQALLDGEAGDRFRRELPPATVALAESVFVFRDMFATKDVAVLEELARHLSAAGVEDAQRWVREVLFVKLFGQGHAGQRQFGRRREEPDFQGDEILRLVEFVERPDAAGNELYDALGKINLWLRRHGLAREVEFDPAQGKAVPVTASDTQVFLPHTTDAVLWPPVLSNAYEAACLRYQVGKEQFAVGAEMEELLTLPDDQFARVAHEDLLKSIFDRADECGLATSERARLSRRLDAVLTVRVKVHHHSGDIRVTTVPQTAALSDVLTELRAWFPDIDRCRLCYLDDGDRVTLASDREYRDLVRTTRTAALSSTSLGTTASASVLARSALIVPGAGEVRVELYVDPEPGAKAASVHSAAASALTHHGSQGPRGAGAPGSSTRTRDAQRSVTEERPSPPRGRAQPGRRRSVEDEVQREIAEIQRRIEQQHPAPRPTAPPPPVATEPDPLRLIERRAQLLQHDRTEPSPPPARAQPPVARPPAQAIAQEAPKPKPKAPSSWQLPQRASFDLAQHTIVGDEDDDMRAGRKM